MKISAPKLRQRALDLGLKAAALRVYDRVRDAAVSGHGVDALRDELARDTAVHADHLLGETRPEDLLASDDAAVASAGRPPYLPFLAMVRYAWHETVRAPRAMRTDELGEYRVRIDLTSLDRRAVGVHVMLPGTRSYLDATVVLPAATRDAGRRVVTLDKIGTADFRQLLTLLGGLGAVTRGYNTLGLGNGVAEALRIFVGPGVRRPGARLLARGWDARCVAWYVDADNRPDGLVSDVPLPGDAVVIGWRL